MSVDYYLVPLTAHRWGEVERFIDYLNKDYIPKYNKGEWVYNELREDWEQLEVSPYGMLHKVIHSDNYKYNYDIDLPKNSAYYLIQYLLSGNLLGIYLENSYIFNRNQCKDIIRVIEDILNLYYDGFDILNMGECGYPYELIDLLNRFKNHYNSKENYSMFIINVC